MDSSLFPIVIFSNILIILMVVVTATVGMAAWPHWKNEEAL